MTLLSGQSKVKYLVVRRNWATLGGARSVSVPYTGRLRFNCEFRANREIAVIIHRKGQRHGVDSE